MGTLALASNIVSEPPGPSAASRSFFPFSSSSREMMVPERSISARTSWRMTRLSIAWFSNRAWTAGIWSAGRSFGTCENRRLASRWICAPVMPVWSTHTATSSPSLLGCTVWASFLPHPATANAAAAMTIHPNVRFISGSFRALSHPIFAAIFGQIPQNASPMRARGRFCPEVRAQARHGARPERSRTATRSRRGRRSARPRSNRDVSQAVRRRSRTPPPAAQSLGFLAYTTRLADGRSGSSSGSRQVPWPLIQT